MGTRVLKSPLARFARHVKAAGPPLMGIWFAVWLHSIWAVALFSNKYAAGSTPLHGLAHLFPNRFGLAVILAIVAGCATGGIFAPLKASKIALLIPQQLVLGISAASSLQAIFSGHYSDGIQRSHSFILTDQVTTVLALLVHSLTIIYLAWRLSVEHDEQRRVGLSEAHVQ